MYAEFYLFFFFLAKLHSLWYLGSPIRDWNQALHSESVESSPPDCREFLDSESETLMHLGTSFGGFPGGSDGKESACNAGDLGSIPGSGRTPGGGHGNPLQYPCLENPHGQRSLAGYSPWGPQRVGHDWMTTHALLHQLFVIKCLKT